MAIVPFYPTRIVEYFSPVALQSFDPLYHRSYYPYFPMRPIVHYSVGYPSVTYCSTPLTYVESSNDYKLINAMYNPGNYWIWPPGQ